MIKMLSSWYHSTPSFSFRMGWRKCSLCAVNTYNRPDLVIFTAQASGGTRYICELHYKAEDIQKHGNSKRYYFISRYDQNHFCLQTSAWR